MKGGAGHCPDNDDYDAAEKGYGGTDDFRDALGESAKDGLHRRHILIPVNQSERTKIFQKSGFASSARNSNEKERVLPLKTLSGATHTGLCKTTGTRFWFVMRFPLSWNA